MSAIYYTITIPNNKPNEGEKQMEQKRFEVGKTYTEDDTNKIGIEIKVLSRTEKTITFIYTKKIGGSRK